MSCRVTWGTEPKLNICQEVAVGVLVMPIKTNRCSQFRFFLSCSRMYLVSLRTEAISEFDSVFEGTTPSGGSLSLLKSCQTLLQQLQSTWEKLPVTVFQLSVMYLKTLTETGTNRTVERLVGHELETVRQEAVVAGFEAVSRHLPEELSNTEYNCQLLSLRKPLYKSFT